MPTATDPYQAIVDNSTDGGGDSPPAWQSQSPDGVDSYAAIAQGKPPARSSARATTPPVAPAIDDPYARIARGSGDADDPYQAIARGGHTASESIPQQILHGVEDIGTGAYQAVRHPLNTIGSLAKGAWEGYRDAALAPLDITPAMLGKTGPGANQHIIIPGAGDLLGVQPVTPERQAEATQRTAANVLLPVLGPEGALGRTATNAALGAINAEPGQRIRGAVGAAGLGEILHRAVGALTGHGAEPEAATAPTVDEAAPSSPSTVADADDPYAAIAKAEPSAEPAAAPTAQPTSAPSGGETPALAAAPALSTDPYADIARSAETPQPSAAQSAPGPVQAAELPAVASEPPMTEIDYTGDKPVVVNAAPAKAIRAPRSAKIDQTIPGREKISAHDQNYAGMPVGDLLDELHTQYGALDKASSNPAVGGWTRFDENEQIMRSGQGLGGAIALQQQKFALLRVQAVERELTRRGVGPEEMAEQMQIRRDRALERPIDENEDVDLSFPGAPETGASDAGRDLDNARVDLASRPSMGGLPRTPLGDPAAMVRGSDALSPGAAGADVGHSGQLEAGAGLASGVADRSTDPGLANQAGGGPAVGDVAPGLPTRLDKFDVDPTGRAELAAEIQRLDALGQLPKARVTFPEMRAQAMDFAKEIGADPLTVDQTKLKNLTGPEIVGLKNVVSRNTDEITQASKQLADPALDADTRAAVSDRLDALRSQRENLLSAIVTNTSDRARDLGFLRQISTRTLDGDVWTIQARRTAGRPLSDLEVARVRGLANDAAQICAGVAA